MRNVSVPPDPRNIVDAALTALREAREHREAILRGKSLDGLEAAIRAEREAVIDLRRANRVATEAAIVATHGARTTPRGHLAPQLRTLEEKLERDPVFAPVALVRVPAVRSVPRVERDRGTGTMRQIGAVL